jgi:zinc protease
MRLLHVTALSVFAAFSFSVRGALPFAQDLSDLHPDPAATFGALPNGFRYVVMPNHEPKGRVSMRLLVLAGSFDETEKQRGLAHFLEHMAFNGSTHYAPGTLVEKLQRLGMGFGADTNASTSFDRTLYELEIPDTAPATIAEGLQILADYSGGLLLKPEMVDKERGIILSEKRARDSVQYRTYVSQMDFMEAGTRVPDRLPIGLSDVIEKSNRDPFVDFYNTWYRPDRMVVLVVGDVDPAAIEKQIVDGFSGITARGPEPAPVDLGRVQDLRGVKILFHGEPESSDTRVVIGVTAPYAFEPDTAARQLALLPRFIAIEMLNRRLAILAKKENAPFVRASAEVDESFGLYREATIEVTCKADQWTAAIGVADQELRRALTFGFLPSELKEAVADFRNDLEQAAKTASTRRSDDLANQLADSIVNHEVFTSPADDLKLFAPALTRMSTGACQIALREAWAVPGRYVFVTGNAKIDGDANAAIAAAYAKSQAIAMKPADELGKVAWAYSDFGPAGAIASRTHVDDLDITQVVFANGVRLDLKKTDFEANTIHVAARLGTGQLTEPAATEPGLSVFTSLTYSAGGLGRHSADDLKRVLAGRSASLQFSSTLDSFILDGDTDKEDVALEFQLLAASLADPGYRPEALRAARKRIDAAYIKFAHTEGGPIALEVSRILAGGDPRFGLPAKEQMLARNLDEEKAWLGPTLASGALEVTVVGDFDIETVITDAAKTIGTLGKREARPQLDDQRKVSFPKEPFTKDYAIDTEIPKSLVAVYWPTADAMDVHRARRLGMLAEILTDRLRVKIREQMGSTYAPNAASSASDILPGYGYLAAIVIAEPSKAKQVQDATLAVAADLNAHGATQDELDRAKNPLITQITETERTNSYWMTVLGRSQERPEVLDWARSRHADFESITKADIDALAKEYLAPEKASRVIIHPYPTPAGAPNAVTPPPDGM